MAQAVIGALRVDLGLNSAAFSKGLKNSQSRLKKFGRVAAKGMLAAGAAAAAAGAGVALAVRGTLNAADEMAKASQKIGIPIEELSRLKHAADLSGVSFSNLQTGTRRLSQNMNDAFNGVGEGLEAFEQLGISVKNADGSMKTSSQVMAEMADAFAAMPDGAEKTALAMDLMGRSGADLIPMLNGGASGLRAMMAEADALGIVFDEKTGKAAEQFNDNLNRLGKMFAGIANQIAADLAPHLAQFTDWLVENAPMIRETMVGAITALIEGFKSFRDAIIAVRDAWQAFEARWDALVQKIHAFPSEVVAVFKALPGQMAEIGRAIIEGLWSGIQERWEALKADVAGLANGIADRFRSVLRIQSPSRVMMEIGRNVMRGLGAGMDATAAAVEGQATSIAGGIQSAFEGIGQGISGAIQGMKSWKDVAIDALKAVASAMAQSVLSNLNFGGGMFGGLLKGMLGGLFSFEGGGSTGGGPRTGGLDGRGGMLAMVHPNESIIDHTRRQAGQQGVHLTIGVSADGNGNILPFVESVSQRTVASAAPSIVSAAKSQTFKGLAQGDADSVMGGRFGVQPRSARRAGG